MAKKTKKVSAKSSPISRLVGFSARHPGQALVIFTIITAILMIPASQLKVDSSIDSFFGDDPDPEIASLMEVEEKFGEQAGVNVVVDCSESNGTVAQQYLRELADALEEEGDFKEIRYIVNRNLISSNAVLYIPQDHLHFLMDPNLTSDVANATFEQMMGNGRDSEEYMVSNDGHIYLMNMVINNTINTVEERDSLFGGLFKTVDDILKDNHRYDDLEVGVTGGFLVSDYEGDTMAMGDLAITGLITFVFIFILLFISFRSLSVPAMSLIPLIMGIVITAGILQLVFGDLGIFAMFFAVLILGLGVDFSIHILARFTDEMEQTDDVIGAFKTTAEHTGKAIVLGSFTTATAFGAFLFSNTEGMKEMGMVSAVGLLVTMICVFAVLPALVTLRLRKKGLLSRMRENRARYTFLRRIGEASRKYSAVLVVILVLLGVFFAIKAPDAYLTTDMKELSPDDLPSHRWEERLQQHFNYTEDYMVCIVSSYDDLVRVVDDLGDEPEVMDVKSILSYLPENQTGKIELIQNAKLSNPQLESVAYLSVSEMSWEDLPKDAVKSWVYKGDDGQEFLIQIKTHGDIYDKEYRTALMSDLDAIHPHIHGMPQLIETLMDSMSRDVIRVCVIAALPIILIIYIGLGKRNPTATILAMVPVIFGIMGVLSVHRILNVDLNLISILTFPLVIGIGIDDGIHVLHRYNEEGKDSVPRVIQSTGKAIFLTTATTCLAFSSLLFASHPGMRSLGQVPVLGLILCLAATLVFLPALIAITLDHKDRQ